MGRTTMTARARALVGAAGAALPRGGGLPAAVGARRNRTMLALLWAQVAIIAAVGVARGFPAVQVAAVMAPIAAAAAGAAAWRGAGQRGRAVLVALGLLGCSAALVLFADGLTEAHFHFFVMIALVSLYQDWVPHLVAFAFVVLHHGVVGTIAPQFVFDHEAGHASAWTWAAVHAGAVAAASLAALAAWRYHEDARAEAARRASDQAALRRVAEAVSAGERGRALLDRIAAEAASIAGTPAAVVVRTDGEDPGRGRVAGAHGPAGAPIGARVAIAPGGAPAGGLAGVPIVAAVPVGGAPWGAVVALAAPGAAIARDAGERLSEFAGLAGASIENATARAELERLASSDSLTGLAGHRAFHQRMGEEVARARRERRPISLVLIDLDHFKRVNDQHGHGVGDAVLVAFARLLASSARAGDVVARVGGEEFALLLPATDAATAAEVAGRLLDGVRCHDFGTGQPMTASAGICDLARARDGEELMRLADGALYWAKANGRDAAVVYSPDVVEALSAEERADRLARAGNLASLRALAHAVDAKDHYTRRHSDRVADVAVRIAVSLGWAPGDCARLRDAGILHDVGKIGVPDSVLLKPGGLTDDEYEQVKQHAALGAAIVAEVLDPEQVLWVRHHHERVDGRGYPDGLTGDELSEGARIMAVADAWDAMTSAREYRSALGVPAALAECRRHAGSQFDPEVVRALTALVDRGAVGDGVPLDALRGAPAGRA